MRYEEELLEAVERIGAYKEVILTGSRAVGTYDENSNWDFVLLTTCEPARVASAVVSALSENLSLLFSHIEEKSPERVCADIYFSEDDDFRHINVRVVSEKGILEDEELRQRRAAGQWKVLLSAEESALKSEPPKTEPLPLTTDEETRLLHEVFKEYPRALAEYHRGRTLSVRSSLVKAHNRLLELAKRSGGEASLSEFEGFADKLSSTRSAEELLSLGKNLISAVRPFLAKLSEERVRNAPQLLDRIVKKFEQALRS